MRVIEQQYSAVRITRHITVVLSVLALASQPTPAILWTKFIRVFIFWQTSLICGLYVKDLSSLTPKYFGVDSNFNVDIQWSIRFTIV